MLEIHIVSVTRGLLTGNAVNKILLIDDSTGASILRSTDCIRTLPCLHLQLICEKVNLQIIFPISKLHVQLATINNS